jgi:cell division septum initiation protein DivIVA
MLAEERPAVGHRIDLLTLVDQLQELIETGPRLPLSDRIVVSSEQLLDLVDAVRNTIPEDVIEAERILQEHHRLVEEAREEADQLLESAREQSKFMLQEHHVIKAAEIKAERIINQAQREADEIMESADDYIQKRFSRLEEEAIRLAGEIRKAAARQA